MSYEFITVEKKGRVGLITLNRPKQLNALSAKLMQELGQALRAFDADAGDRRDPASPATKRRSPPAPTSPR